MRLNTFSNHTILTVALRYFTFDIYELLLRQGLAIHRIRPILGDVLLDQPALKHLVGHRGDARVLRNLVRDYDKTQRQLKTQQQHN